MLSDHVSRRRKMRRKDEKQREEEQESRRRERATQELLQCPGRWLVGASET
jgi:hypothetical protein